MVGSTQRRYLDYGRRAQTRAHLLNVLVSSTVSPLSSNLALTASRISRRLRGRGGFGGSLALQAALQEWQCPSISLSPVAVVALVAAHLALAGELLWTRWKRGQGSIARRDRRSEPRRHHLPDLPGGPR